MIFLVVAAILMGQQEPRLVFIPVDSSPTSYGLPSNALEADYNIAYYEAQCLASALATRAARQNLGLPVSATGDAANRAAVAAIALESQTWGYTRTATVTVQRATEMIEAIEFLLPYLEEGEQPPEDERLHTLWQAQSDCQSAEQSRLQLARFIQLEALGGIATVSTLVDCAALYNELVGNDQVVDAHIKAQTLMSLGQATSQNDTPLTVQLTRLRAEFMTDFVSQGLTPSDPYYDLVVQRITFCEGQFDDLDTGGYLENHRP